MEEAPSCLMCLPGEQGNISLKPFNRPILTWSKAVLYSVPLKTHSSHHPHHGGLSWAAKVWAVCFISSTFCLPLSLTFTSITRGQADSPYQDTVAWKTHSKFNTRQLLFDFYWLLMCGGGAVENDDDVYLSAHHNVLHVWSWEGDSV